MRRVLSSLLLVSALSLAAARPAKEVPQPQGQQFVPSWKKEANSRRSLLQAPSQNVIEMMLSESWTLHCSGRGSDP